MTDPDRPQTTTERGLGARHRRQRIRLLRGLADGTPCYWCGRGMFRDETKNWDGKPLEADHTLARSRGGTDADRLLCSTCNRQRGAGDQDHLRPALTGQWPPAATPPTPLRQLGFQPVNVTFT